MFRPRPWPIVNMSLAIGLVWGLLTPGWLPVAVIGWVALLAVLTAAYRFAGWASVETRMALGAFVFGVWFLVAVWVLVRRGAVGSAFLVGALALAWGFLERPATRD